MSAHRVETLKKAAFLHDLGKLLNWSGELHPLDGARVLKYLGFDDTVVGMALYHHPKYRQEIKDAIEKPDCAGLEPRDCYDEYSLLLGELVDKLMAGFDRLGEEGKAARTRPVVLRNPLTHLPLDGTLRQFEATHKGADGTGPDSDYLREFVKGCYLPGASLKPLDADGKKSVYRLDDPLAGVPLLRVLAENKDAPFNTLYHALRTHSDWQALTRRLIPQGHSPSTDTLALWYHLQFSSAMAGLYWAEGFRTADQIEAELNRLGEQPVEVKIGLLYIHIAGLTEYFATAYRLPDFNGTQEIAKALKKAVKEQLLEAEHKGEPFIWEDSFLYEGHDDFLVMVPVQEPDPAEGPPVYGVLPDDPFRQRLEEVLDTGRIVARAVDRLLSEGKPRIVLARSPRAPEVFGNGERLRKTLGRLVSIETAFRCFAGFTNGSELTPHFGVVWNRLRAEARGRLPRPQAGVRSYAGDVCDCCRANLAGHDPVPNDPREWAEVDWGRDIIKDEDWGERPLHYWIFRGTDAPVRGEGDKLCHACLLRRILGHGTSLQRIAPEMPEEEQPRIAVIKGNVNRTLWYVGGSLTAEGPLSNEHSVYSRVWCEEIARPIFERSQAGSGPLGEALERLQNQALCAAPRGSGAKLLELGPLDLPALGLSAVEAGDLVEFVARTWKDDPFESLNLAGLHYHPQQRRWQRVDDALRALYLRPEGADANWLTEAQRLIQEQPLPGDWLSALWDKYPNPWSPYPISPAELDELVLWLFSGTPHFVEDNEDLPTPSRTMTVSWLIDRAVKEVHDLVSEDVGDVVYAEGDEFLVVCRAEEAPRLARRIIRRVVACLNSLPEDQVEPPSDFLPVTLALGVVVAKRKHPLYDLLELADRLVRSAKKAHPNGSAIDFENVVGGVDEAHLDREVFSREWLSRRPLTLTEFAGLLEDVDRLKGAKFAKRQLQQVAALMVGVLGSRPDRRVAALAYVYQPHEGKGWGRVRHLCEEGTFQDMLTLWHWPQQKWEGKDAETSG